MNTSSIPNAADGYLVYDGKAIRRRGGLLNLTSMWHAIGRPPNRRPRDWLALPETERFVLHLRNAPPASPEAIIADIAGLSFIRNIDGDFLFVTTHERKRALWAHWHIAFAYAQYLCGDPI
jgi:hypothetical protein